ncbi:Polycystin-2 [Durusdinium trenchii]|uniref:Polycystin-2 n=1 Tax=Durusdinium trenchii TaxID=1381693 RepID=A0ABP0MCH5_9DINO
MILLLVGFTMRMLLFSDAANANVGIEQLSNKESFQNISALAAAATTVRVLNAFNCVLLWGKVTKYLRHLPLVKGLIRTVWDAFDLFLPFLIMFCVGMVGFVMAFNVGFGDKVAELSNFSTSAVYLCRAFLKDVQLMPVCAYTAVPWFAVGGGLLSELRSSGWIEVESERCELGSWFAKSELRAALRTRQRYDITPLFGAGLILLFYLNMIAVRRPARLRFREGLEEKFGERVDKVAQVTSRPGNFPEYVSWVHGALCQKVNGTLNEESAWQHLCQKYWHSSDARLKDWPVLSAKGLYRALEQWMPMEGFYVLTNAFPWGLLALLSIEQGQLCARMVRFLPQGESITEIQVPFFQVSVSEERGNIRSVIQAPWLQFDSMATIAPIESSQLVASTQDAIACGLW